MESKYAVTCAPLPYRHAHADDQALAYASDRYRSGVEGAEGGVRSMRRPLCQSYRIVIITFGLHTPIFYPSVARCQVSP